MRFYIALCICFIAFLITFHSVAVADDYSDPIATIRITAAEHPVENTPIWADLPDGLELPKYVTLKARDGRLSIPAQIETLSPTKNRLWWIERSRLAKGESREYQLFRLHQFRATTLEHVEIKDFEGQYRFNIDQKTVLAYNHATVSPPAGTAEHFKRSGFIHPVYTPDGTVVTDGMPMPHHTHQHGIMFAWTNTRFNDRTIDFWNAQALQGTIRHERTQKTTEGPVFAEAVVMLRHFEMINDDENFDYRLVLEETWTIRVFNLGDPYMFDIKSVQDAPGAPLKIMKYHYGAMGIRGASAWQEGNGVIRTSAGLDRVKGNHTRPRWVYMAGPKEKITAGILAMSSTNNFRSLQPVRLHPIMPYFCFAPHILGDMTIEPNKPYESKFRFVVDDGEISDVDGNQYWNDYTKRATINASIDIHEK